MDGLFSGVDCSHHEYTCNPVYRFRQLPSNVASSDCVAWQPHYFPLWEKSPLNKAASCTNDVMPIVAKIGMKPHVGKNI